MYRIFLLPETNFHLWWKINSDCSVFHHPVKISQLYHCWFFFSNFWGGLSFCLIRQRTLILFIFSKSWNFHYLPLLSVFCLLMSCPNSNISNFRSSLCNPWRETSKVMVNNFKTFSISCVNNKYTLSRAFESCLMTL